MKTVATMTMNPTIDVSYDVGTVRHTHKMRTDNEWYAPGGGGINVARVLTRLQTPTRCLYTSGGATGTALDGLIDSHKLDRVRIPVQGHTRIASAVLERESGKEYRFTPQGPRLSDQETAACLQAMSDADCDIVVLSGSLPQGVPHDFYAQAVAFLRPKGIEVVLDSSGDALTQGIDAGGLKLIKPSKGELSQYVGKTLDSKEALARAVMDIVEGGKSDLVAVTMGHDGAILGRAEGPIYLPGLQIEAASAVGAGDSFVAGMVHACCAGMDDVEAFRFGLASGSAAVLRPGTDLARPDDIQRLLNEVGQPEPIVL